MESSSVVGQCLSPESTVTSLLSSSGYLRSSLVVPEHTTTFRYKHKLYDSASAALNAYIADFNSSRPAEKTLTGNLSASHRLPPTPNTPRATTLRNKDVLREHLTDRELDILSLPDISLAYSPTRNRVSMTTDELLSIPYDGSMPVTHTSAFIQGLLSPPAAPQPPSRPARTAHSRLLSTHAIPEVSQQVPPRRHPSSSRGRRAAAAASRAEVWAEPSSSLRLHHWLTSNKWDVDESDAGVPNVKYPPWIHCCDTSRAAASSPGVPSWVAELEEEEEEDSEHTHSQAGSQRTLRDLRLQLAEQISLLAAERSDSSVKEKLCRDHRVELLLQKADRVLDSLAQGCRAAEPPADPQELLPWSSPPSQPDSLESPAGGSAAAPQAQPSRHGNGNAKQPGSAEALKQVLFRLHAVEAQLQQQQQQQEEASATPEVEVPQQQEADAGLGPSPDSLSLQRALHLLTNLRVLVEEPREEEQEKAEKDEDEGRYSSVSTDSFASAEQKSS